MRLSKIRLSGISNIDLNVAGASPGDRFVLKDVTGLGPTEHDVLISNTRKQGGLYQGRNAQLREVVVRIGLNPKYALNETASDLRNEIYDLLVPGEIGKKDMAYCQLFEGSDLWGYSTGYFRRIEIVPTAKDPEVQVTMACLSAYFTGPLRIIDHRTKNKNNFYIKNIGSAPTGFYMRLEFTQNRNPPMSGGSIAGPSWWIQSEISGKRMSFLNPFENGDELIIDTRPGFRKVQRLRGAVTTDLISALQLDEEWFMLRKGNNTFTTSNQRFTWKSINYYPQYVGI